jgi:hypothetical protein
MITEQEQADYIVQVIEGALGDHPAKTMILTVAVKGWMEGKVLAKAEGIGEEEAWESFKQDVLHKIPKRNK